MNDSIIHALESMFDKINISEKAVNEVNSHAKYINSLITKELKKAHNTIDNLISKISRLEYKLLQSENKPSELLCIICFENERNVLFKPCNHLLICDKCSGSTDFQECIVCKQTIDEYEYAYI
jgi:predicted transcriptional regulator